MLFLWLGYGVYESVGRAQWGNWWASGEGHVARNCGQPLGGESSPLANNQQENRTSVLQQTQEVNSVNKVRSLEADFSPVKPMMRPLPWPTPGLYPGKTLRQRTQLSCALTSDLQKL